MIDHVFYLTFMHSFSLHAYVALFCEFMYESIHTNLNMLFNLHCMSLRV
jgi:hypothetical protein